MTHVQKDGKTLLLATEYFGDKSVFVDIADHEDDSGRFSCNASARSARAEAVGRPGAHPIIEGAGGLVASWDDGDAQNGGCVIAAGDARVHAQALELLRNVPQ